MDILSRIQSNFYDILVNIDIIHLKDGYYLEDRVFQIHTYHYQDNNHFYKHIFYLRYQSYFKDILKYQEHKFILAFYIQIYKDIVH